MPDQYDNSPESLYKRASARVDEILPRFSRMLFTKEDIYRESGLLNRPEDRPYREAVGKVLYNISDQNKERVRPVIKQIQRNCYKVVDYTVTPINWKDAKDMPLFDLHFPIDTMTGQPLSFAQHINICPKDIIVIAGESNKGKGHPYGTLILTNAGWKPIEKIQVGENVFTEEGIPSKVIGVYPRGEQSCYRFTFSDGSTIESDTSHIWNIQRRTCNRKFGGHGALNRTYKTWQNWTTQKIVAKSGTGKIPTWMKFTIPKVKPVQFPSQMIPVDAYALGLLLGDGCFSVGNTSITFSTADVEVLSAFSHYGKTSVNNQYDYGIYGGMKTRIRELGLEGKLSNTKFIPHQYLWNDIETRLAVLQGLMDTDGSVIENGEVEYSTVSRQLADDVLFLVQSLGGRARITTKHPHYTYKDEKKTGQLSYRMKIKLYDFCPFRLERKARRYKIQAKTSHRTISYIEDVGRKKTICISTDNPTGLYVAQHFIVTHNTTLCMNFAIENMNTYPVTLWISEGSELKIARRMKIFEDRGLLREDGTEKFEVLRLDKDPADCASLRPENINIFDWINVIGDFWNISNVISSIEKQLTTGIAIVAIQKADNEFLGRGASFSRDWSSLYMTLSKLDEAYFKMELVKVKDYNDISPEGNLYRFMIVDRGSHIHDLQEIEMCKNCKGTGNRGGGQCTLCEGRKYYLRSEVF